MLANYVMCDSLTSSIGGITKTIETDTDLLLKALKGFLSQHFTMSAGSHTLFSATVRRVTFGYYTFKTFFFLALLSSLV